MNDLKHKIKHSGFASLREKKSKEYYCTATGRRIPTITSENKPNVNQIETLVDKILSAKKENPQSDTSHLEREIDELVYKLYNLTYEEAEIIDPQIGSIISKEEYEKFEIK